ncbi:MAG: hypothetical protein A2219_02075 [Elusimicrobia bacterium RIFOXYA2_FULL_50_26]|nr:MAG: hypothetical protein A2219_02075 [Elusimicrobia bacterium RIFOXYA2_FULL_50_26]OGS23600.1 MAG: hypothetical protein A2314_09105 [Elusimicrobia bacterium RIFOXYB2_FULL_50_12]
MPRHGRIEIPGGVYHIIVRGIERRTLFKDKADYQKFLNILEKGLKSFKHQCLAWVLMPNHVHLLLRQGDAPLSKMMRGILTGYALYFNHKYKRSGYVYQNRYKSIMCQEDVYFLELVRYIHLNPVRAGIVMAIEGLDSYPWTGHSVLAGKFKRSWQSTEEVLKLFGPDTGAAWKKYRAFMIDGWNMGKNRTLTGGGIVRSAGGWRKLMQLKASDERWQGDERILGDGSFVEDALRAADAKMTQRARIQQEGWTLETLADHVCKLVSICRNDIKRRGRNGSITKGRELFCFWAKEELMIDGQAIANYLNMSKMAVSKNVRKGEDYARQMSLKFISLQRP